MIKAYDNDEKQVRDYTEQYFGEFSINLDYLATLGDTLQTHTYRIEFWQCHEYCSPYDEDLTAEKTAVITITLNFLPPAPGTGTP
jgi:hypothetical protein